MSNQKQIRLTFRQHSKTQQAIFDHLKDEPDLIMTALIDRYSFLALAEIDRPEKELAKALIESNAALMKAIEINNAIAARQGIATGQVTAVSSPSPIPSPPPSTKVENPDDDDDDWDDDDDVSPEPHKGFVKPRPVLAEGIEEMLSKL